MHTAIDRTYFIQLTGGPYRTGNRFAVDEQGHVPFGRVVVAIVALELTEQGVPEPGGRRLDPFHDPRQLDVVEQPQRQQRGVGGDFREPCVPGRRADTGQLEQVRVHPNEASAYRRHPRQIRRVG